MAPIDRSGAASRPAGRASGRPPCRARRPPWPARRPAAARTAGIAVRVLVRQHLEGQRLQGVAGQDRGRLVELLVTGGLAAPQIVVVHRRQVVVDQRIGVQEFDGAGGAQGGQRADLEQRCAGQHEERAQPLAAAQARIAHRLEDARFVAVAPCQVRQKAIHGVFGRRGGKRQRGLEVAVRRQRHGSRTSSDRRAGCRPSRRPRRRSSRPSSWPRRASARSAS